MVQVVILNANGESRTCKTAAVETGITGISVAKIFRKNKPASIIGNYTWRDMLLTVWGFTEGKAGQENKHELPPPHDEILLFGDAVMIATTDGVAVNFVVEKYTEFYNEAFKGFEDLGDDEEDDDLEEDEVDDVEDEVEEEEEEEEAEEEVEEEVEEEDVDDDCYDDGEDTGGGTKRRAPRRRTAQAPEYRRIDMGLRSRIKIPTPIGKRAPRWQTTAELELDSYDA